MCCFDLEVNQITNEVVLISFMFINMFTMLAVQKGFVPDTYKCIDDIYYCFTLREFAKMLKRVTACMDIYLFGFNSMKFDFCYLIPYLLEHDLYSVVEAEEKCILLGTQYSGFIRYNDNSSYEYGIILRDYLKYGAPTSLKALGDNIGLPKLEAEDRTFNKDINDEDIKYCCRDTEILYHGLCKFLSVMKPFVDKGWLLSPGHLFAYHSTSQLIFYVSMQRWKETVYRLGNAYTFGRRCYYGARVDSQIYGQEHICKIGGIDITSMYPSAMRNPLPIGRVSVWTDVSLSLFDIHPLDHKPTIAYVKLYKKQEDNTRERYGLVPVRLDEQTFGYFNSGIIYGVYTDVDLWAFVKDGWKIMKVYCGIQFDKWSTTLKEYMEEWYSIKASYKKDTPEYLLAKIILNGTYGKYAQIAGEGKNTGMQQIGWYCLSWTRHQLLYFKNISIQYGAKILFYGDTDSMFMDYECFEKIMEGESKQVRKDLGDCNDVTFDKEPIMYHLIVLGKKTYHGTTKCGIKGFGRLTYEDFQKVLKDGHIEVKSFRPNSMRDIVNGYEVMYKLPFTEFVKKLKVTAPIYTAKCNICNLYSPKTVHMLK